jgi:hypothetical protein
VSGSPIKRRTEVKNTRPIRKIEGSKAPMETRTTLIRYFINDIGQQPPRRLPVRAAAMTPITDEVDGSRSRHLGAKV